jgi:hypothetical protein
MCYAPSGEFIATACAGGTLRLWHEVLPAVGAATVLSERLTCHYPCEFTDVAVTPNSEYVMATCQDNFSLVYSTRTGHLVSRLAHFGDPSHNLATSLNGYVEPTHVPLTGNKLTVPLQQTISTCFIRHVYPDV